MSIFCNVIEVYYLLTVWYAAGTLELNRVFSYKELVFEDKFSHDLPFLLSHSDTGIFTGVHVADKYEVWIYYHLSWSVKQVTPENKKKNDKSQNWIE